MPIYEYSCPDCQLTFDTLRPMADANAPIPCPTCESNEALRVISRFAAISKGNGGSQMLAGGGGCSNCSGHACHSCASAN